MSKRLGHVSYHESEGFTKPFSDNTAQAIDEEVERHKAQRTNKKNKAQTPKAATEQQEQEQRRAILATATRTYGHTPCLCVIS